MATTLNPYLAFPGTAAEAMAFYHHVLGGTLDSSTFGDSGMGSPDEAHKIMHAQLETEAGHTLMGSDIPDGMPLERGTPQVSLSGDDETLLRRWWEGLSDGATVMEDLQQAPWGDIFGMLIDRYGVLWMVNVVATPTE
ncbi:VOC family protein [Agrococcus jejuensis]|uniref:PhnB protein n=1 Tax=Agrococcus jejuensis TaxID=399736 RepID=A0A1G8ADF8_9MICO|nr:VOC family protein [Agrococcus jejuensis]SDH18958.1 PhnB protein [Agrococcus jejuensis]